MTGIEATNPKEIMEVLEHINGSLYWIFLAICVLIGVEFCK